MTESFLPFALPDIGEQEIEAVVSALRSGWITTGPRTRQFETEFASLLGDGLECVAVNSATAGMHLALEALGIGPGDEVITTTYTFTATAEVVRYLGADPVFVDVSAQTLNIDCEQVEARITPRTRAIMPVHFAGLCCDMDAIFEIAERHNIAVIEDAAHALPTRYKGDLVGNLRSDATIFSFYATKTITTGEGGMIATRNPDLAKRCRIMRLHGIDRDVFDRYSAEKPSWWYEIVAPGYKYNMTDIAAAIGIEQLKKVNTFQHRRQEIAERYLAAFGDLALELPARAPVDDLHAWHLFVIRLTEQAPIDRDTFIQRMADKGIGCSVHFIPLHLHPYWRDTYKLQPGDFPRAQRAFTHAISLPLYTRMTATDVERVVSGVRDILING